MFSTIRFTAFVMIASSAMGQPLRDINYNYLYDPDQTVALQLKAIRNSSDWVIHYALHPKDTSNTFETYVIEWGTRESLGEKESKSFYPTDLTGTVTGGSFHIPFSNQPIHLIAKVINKPMKRAWIFYQSLEPNSPVNAFAEKNRKILFAPYINFPDSVTLRGIPSGVGSYYNDLFPVAQPPFTEAQGKVSKGMKTDSTFVVREGVPLKFSKKGLYLIQSDTNSTSGVAIRAEDDYPKFGKVSSLVGPMVYITTAQEYSKLLQAKNEKKAFDRVILSITNDQERARSLMKNYFRRIELANQYFTSYKEGWKTDRGMVYIVFGLPDEVFKFNDREVWNYSLTKQNLSFSFVKSSSVFDPDNYVLLRDQKYQQAWYETIDLWRGSRF